jgi:hypothetical protein
MSFLGGRCARVALGAAIVVVAAAGCSSKPSGEPGPVDARVEEPPADGGGPRRDSAGGADARVAGFPVDAPASPDARASGGDAGPPSDAVALRPRRDGGAPPTSRDPWLWPFATDSIWNTPIGANADYQAEGAIGAAPVVNADPETHHKVRATDPVRPLYTSAGGCTLGRMLRTIQIPDDLLLPTQISNNVAALLMPDGKTIEQLQPFFRCEVGGPVVGIPNPFAGGVDIFGPGAVGTHWGSGLSGIGGSLRHGELTGAGRIRHALKINVWGRKYLHFDAAADRTPGYRWPATVADKYAGNPADGNRYQGTEPKLEQGALLAIPPRHTVASLGLATEPGAKLFEALQDFGAYIVDDTAGDFHAFSIERTALGEFEEVYGFPFDVRATSTGDARLFYDDLTAIIRALAVVDDNGEENVGGGGARRASPAPPFRQMDATPPTAPGGLALVETGTRQVKLSFGAARDDVGVTGYEIFAAGVKRAETYGRTTVTVRGLLPDTAYAFTVRAKDGSQNVSPPSAPIEVKTMAIPPGTYEEDFENANPRCWAMTNAKIAEGRLQLGSFEGSASAIFLGGTFGSELTLRANVRGVGTATGNKARILFGWVDADNTHIVEISGRGAAATVALQARVAGKTTTLATATGWSYAGIEVQGTVGGAVSVFGVGGAEARVAVLRDVKAPGLAAGAIGFSSGFNEVAVDGVLATGGVLRACP